MEEGLGVREVSIKTLFNGFRSEAFSSEFVDDIGPLADCEDKLSNHFVIEPVHLRCVHRESQHQ